MRRLAVLPLVALLAGLVPGCAAVQGDEGGYHVTAFFSRAVGLYPHGDVLVMGLPAGTVDDVVIEDTQVRVEMTIHDDIPLPADVRATVEARTLIGERHVTLFPPWDASMAAAGADRIGDGDEIPIGRTIVPVEPDEGLAAFNDLARSLDPEVIGRFVSDSARALDGQGEAIGRALEAGSSLSDTLAGIDTDLVAAAEHLHVLAGSLAARESQLQSLIESFGQAAGVLASERDGIATFLSSLLALTDEGQRLLDLYGEQLPDDIADLTALASVFDQNGYAAEELVAMLPTIAEGLNAAYRPEIDGFFLRASGSTTLQAVTDELVRLLDILGLVPGGPS
jgi:virulence factor Mce-like protein